MTDDQRKTGIEKHKTIILLHGLGETESAMKLFEYIFINHGYRVMNMEYSVRNKTFNQVCTETLDRINNTLRRKSDKICFVGHALGGIIAKHLTASNKLLAEVQSVVMVGSQYSALDLLQESKMCRTISSVLFTRRFVDDLTNGKHYVKTYGKVKYGRIIGVKKFSLLNPVSWVVKYANKDTDWVLNAEVEYIEVDEDRTVLTKNKEVAYKILTFVDFGSFR